MATALLGAIICLASGSLLATRWWPPIEEGIDALDWPTTEGLLVHASFRSEYNAAQSHGMDGEVRDEYTDLSVAYWAHDTKGRLIPLTTGRFDTASGLLSQPGLLTGNDHEIKHVLNAGHSLRVRFDPNDPSRAVVYPGPPWSFTVLFAIPVALFGVTVGLLRWSVRQSRGDLGVALLWPVLFGACVTILAGTLPAISIATFGGTMPWGILPVVYAGCLIAVIAPSSLKFPPMREFAIVLPVVTGAALIGGVVLLAINDHRAAFGTEWDDAEVLSQLEATHPAMAARAARLVFDGEGPRAAAPALEELLRSDALDTRRYAALALSRIGLAAFPALDTVEDVIDEPANETIRETLESTRKHLRRYIWAREQVDQYRHRLLHDEDPQARNGAAFSLGQLGESAVSAIPDLERAALDPRNRWCADQMQSVIEKLRRYPPQDGADVAEPGSGG